MNDFLVGLIVGLAVAVVLAIVLLSRNASQKKEARKEIEKYKKMLQDRMELESDGIVKLKDSELDCANTVRSSMTSQKLWILDKVASIACLAGARCEVSGSYPGWSYNPHSAVKDAILSSYKELFGRDATVEAVHAGIECGLFADSIPELDCVSIGPDLLEIHTPRERMSIPSVQRVWAFLLEVLRRSR